MKRLLFFILVLFVLACSREKSQDVVEGVTEGVSSIVQPDTLFESGKEQQQKQVDSILFLFDLVNIREINPMIKVDLKYAGTDNFMKIRLYERMDKAYLQRDIAMRLSKCQDYLTKLHPELHLLVYDAVRPVSVQFKMWNALDTIPVPQRGKFVSSPYKKSVHNYGAAVDLTICDAVGKPLDMGAGFDDIREIAYPSKEAYYLSKGELTKEHIQNRELLRKVMRSQGFRNLPTEWWHFNACSRDEAAKRYKLLEEEP